MKRQFLLNPCVVRRQIKWCGRGWGLIYFNVSRNSLHSMFVPGERLSWTSDGSSWKARFSGICAKEPCKRYRDPVLPVSHGDLWAAGVRSTWCFCHCGKLDSLVLFQMLNIFLMRINQAIRSSLQEQKSPVRKKRIDSCWRFPFHRTAVFWLSLRSWLTNL